MIALVTNSSPQPGVTATECWEKNSRWRVEQLADCSSRVSDDKQDKIFSSGWFVSFSLPIKKIRELFVSCVRQFTLEWMVVIEVIGDGLVVFDGELLRDILACGCYVSAHAKSVH